MSYSDKIALAERIITDHNASIQSQELKLDWRKIHQELVKIGATSEEALAQCAWEDLEACGIPRLLARRLATEVFRPKAASNAPTFVSERMAERMSPEELLARYNPDQPLPNPIASKLKTLGKNARFVVFTPEATIDVPASTKLLLEIQKGFGEREVYVGPDGRSRRIFAVGDKPNNLVDQNPLYPSRVLRPDGTCDQTQRSWDGIPQEIRVLLLLAITKTSEVTVTSRDKAHDLMDMAVRQDAAKEIRTRYPKASVLYDELKERSELPSMKVSFKRPVQDFAIGENRTF